MAPFRSIPLLGRLATAAGLALLLAACQPSGPEFKIVSGSENNVLEPIVQEFCKSKGATCTMSYQGSLDIGLSLREGSESDADAVWPAAGIWIDLFDSKRKVKDLKSIAQTPVILGVRKAKAQELGWINKPVAMADILAAVDSGKLKFLMTSATQSNSGASAYLAMLSAIIGKEDVIQSTDLDDQAVQDKVAALLGGVARSSGSSGWLADLYVSNIDKGQPFDAMWNYEAVLKETNDKLKEKGAEPLYAIYPVDGVGIADSPLGFVDRGRGADVSQFFADLQAYLLSPDVQQKIADTGRRLPLGGPVAKAEPDWNFDPGKLVTAIRTPEPDVIRKALDLYQSALRRPSLTALCLDFSGSMQGEGERQLKEAANFLFTPERASEVLVQWSMKDQIIVIPFTDLTGDPVVATGFPEDQTKLLDSIRYLSAEGGTDMYGCGDAALQAMAPFLKSGKYLPAIVMMTDGKSDGDKGGFMSRWQRDGQGVPIFGITFGDADKSQLDELAATTGARVFDGTKDLAGAFRAARGYN